MSGFGTAGFESLIPRFETFDEGMVRERADRYARCEGKLSFGNAFLDDCFSGIYRDDLILFSAKTGKGKTQLCTQIALHNAKLGKRIHYFALEADRYEIVRRIKFKYICDAYYQLVHRPKGRLNYRDWLYGKYRDRLASVEQELDNKLPLLPTLKIYYRDEDFTAETFERIFGVIKDETDLVILDHLQYFDSDDENENRAIKKIVKKIRDCAQLHRKPVILVSHVRKDSSQYSKLMPELDDFFGSSDVVKIGTKIFVTAPFTLGDSRTQPTLIRALKFRDDGGAVAHTGLLSYGFSSGAYSPEYRIGKIVNGEFTESAVSDLPEWASESQACLTRNLCG